MKSAALALLVGAVLLVVGSLSSHWLGAMHAHEGVFMEERCDDDELERFAAVQAGRDPGPTGVHCRHAVLALELGGSDGTGDIAFWSLLMATWIAGLAASVMVSASVRALRGRASPRLSRAILVAAGLGLLFAGAGLAFMISFEARGTYAIEYGATCYASGALLAMFGARGLISSGRRA